LPSLRQLRCFLLVEQEGSIGRAAEEMGITQPTASHAIGRLEKQVGAILLIRHADGTALSHTGELFAVRVLRFFDCLKQGISALQLTADLKPDSKLRMVHLRAHVAIAECGTFTAAARSLGITGPALHRSARELETLLPRQLYKATKAGVGVNAVGEVFARQMRLALSELVQAREEIVHPRPSAPTPIAVGILPLLPKRWIAGVITRAKELHADSRIEIREGNYTVLLKELRWGAIDLIVGALQPSSSDADISQEPLFADPYVVVVRREHPLARLSLVEPEMLLEHDWVIPSYNLPRRAILEEFLSTLPKRPEPAKIWLNTNSPGTTLAALAGTDCVTLMSRLQVLMDGLDLAILPIAAPGSDRVVGISTRKDWLPTQRQQAFLQLCRDMSPRPGEDGFSRGASALIAGR
jgi:DNA-binding transcriptional LysR family regulator